MFTENPAEGRSRPNDKRNPAEGWLLYGNFPILNSYNDATPNYVAYRHGGGKTVNAVYLDGHMENINYGVLVNDTSFWALYQ